MGGSHFVIKEITMDQKTIGILATLGAAFLCGCPGAGACLFGAMTAAGFGTYTSDFGTPDSGQISPGVAIAIVCVGLILLLIPIAVGFFTLRKKDPIEVEAIPPTS